MPSSLYIGLMSGTSLDGIDCAIVDFSGPAPRLIGASLFPFVPALRAELLALQQACDNELQRSALAANALADAYACAVAGCLQTAKLASSEIVAIGMHGQTIRHRPELGYTLQIGNAARLSEASGITVVSDFRSRDIAAGGQGAPLVPAFHQRVFGADVHRVIVNIGGIANLTDLPPAGPVRGWDSGPGNVLMDGWIARQQGLAFDADGAWAATSQAHPALLASMLEHAYFAQTPPKSTGRDLFDLAWLDQILIGYPNLDPAQVQATLLELTARSIADQVAAHCPAARQIYICGGGARNGALMNRLASLLAPRQLASTEQLGLHPDWVEALAFAWLAKQCLAGQTANLPAVTGARGERILGAVYQR